jgi:hypothetical protein
MGNRTGIGIAPELAKRMLEAPEEFPPSSPGTAEAMAAVRAAYAGEAEPIGTMPPPASVKQAAKAVVQGVTGAHPIVLQDKLAERLAFERAGTRLYDALLSKHDAGRTFRGGPSRRDIEHIRNEEHRHVLMLLETIREAGGDPTVVSPSANVQAVVSKGLPAVLADPRTDVLQCLEALLVAELADNECWTALIELAEDAGDRRMVERFGEALQSEREHLQMVRGWVAAGTGRSVERVRKPGASASRDVGEVHAGGARKVGSRARRKSPARSGSRARKTATKSRRKRAAR